jgi:uncharacterized protein YjiK
MSTRITQAGCRSRTARWRWVRWLALAGLLCAAHALQLDGRLSFALHRGWPHALAQEASLAPGGYRVRVEAQSVAGVADNLSGLAYDAARDQLWAVVNEPPELLALDKHGALLARYPLTGFDDVEGVAWLGGDLLLLTEERRHALVAVTVPQVPGPLDRSAQWALTLSAEAGNNHGFEGVAYDRGGDRLFVVKEHSPRRLYEIRGLRASLAGSFALEIIYRSAWIHDKVFATDLASVEFDPRSGHLLVLSEAAKLVVELDAGGQLVASHPLARGFAGLARSVPQAEGIALDDDGTLFLVSEPNLFYAFGRD